MKRTLYILSLILLSAFTACEIEPEVQISPNPTGPEFIFPTNGQAFNYNWDNENDTVNFIWKGAEYGFPIEPAYAIVIDKAGNNFAKPIKLGSSATDTLVLTASRLNAAIKRLKFRDGVEGEVEMTVTSSINSKVADIVSSVVKFKFTTYSQPIVIIPDTDPIMSPIYLLDDANPNLTAAPQ